MRKRDARKVQAGLLMGTGPDLDDRTKDELEELASDLDVTIEAKEGSGDRPVKDDLLRDLGAALSRENISPWATSLMRAGVLAEMMPEEIARRITDLLPDSSWEVSWTKAYLNEWKKNETTWWAEHGDFVENTYFPLLAEHEEQDDEDGDEEEDEDDENPEEVTQKAA